MELGRIQSEEGKITLVTLGHFFLGRRHFPQKPGNIGVRGRPFLVEWSWLIYFCLPTLSASEPLRSLPNSQGHTYKQQDQVTSHSMTLACLLLVALIEP